MIKVVMQIVYIVNVIDIIYTTYALDIMIVVSISTSFQLLVETIICVVISIQLRQKLITILVPLDTFFHFIY